MNNHHHHRQHHNNQPQQKKPSVLSEQISENFMRRDFSCRCPECNQSFKMSMAMIGVLESIIGRFGIKVDVVKGFICEAAASKLEIIKKSYHAMGKAVDIRVPHEKIVEVFRYLETLPEVRGLGIDLENNVIHIDSREKEPQKWLYLKGERTDLTAELRSRYELGDDIAAERKDFITA
jgi:uncharacterized protein YcbK (DUF882 family)